jgi:hypothetical protein
MSKSTWITSAAVLLSWIAVAVAQDGPNVNLPRIGEPDTTAGTCYHGGRSYASGTVICKDDGFQYKCSDGGWENRGQCPPEDTAPNGASVPQRAVLQPPPPDQPLAPEELAPAEP